MATSHALTWRVTESTGYETAWVELGGEGLRARGRAVGTDPAPYWVDYALETDDRWVTRRLRVTVERAEPAGGGGTTAAAAHLELRHDGAGRWTADGETLPQVDGALDCDLALCPLTNTMPVLRHGLHRNPAAGERTFLMAWVALPELTVHASTQTYTPVPGPAAPAARTGTAARIRFTSGDFSSDLDVDHDGFVVDYPGMAHRLPD